MHDFYHRTGPIVAKVGGTTLEDASSSPALWRALIDLHRTHAGGVIILHGGGKAVDRQMDRLGFTTERREGIRITPDDQVEEIAGVLAGRINKALVGTLNAMGAKGVGLCLGDGGAIATAKTTKYAFDPGRVGEVTGGDGELLRVLLATKYLPVVSSIGLDADGKFLNVNGDDAAAGIAGVMGAAALILFTDVPGILDGQKKLVREITPAGIERMVASGEISGGMIVKARSASAVATKHQLPVLILSGNNPDSLRDWMEGKESGTRIDVPSPKK
jgi:acetylglutamate kinase